MRQNKECGFSLLEVLLVCVVVGIMLVLGGEYMQQRTQQARLDRTTVQMQQILMASLAFYTANSSTWPVTIATPGITMAANPAQCVQDLVCDGFLPTGYTGLTPWGPLSSYSLSSPNPSLLTLTLTLPPAVATRYGMSVATFLANSLPMGVAASSTSVQASISQITVSGGAGGGTNTYVGIYHNGGCVPAPTTCSASQTPQIYVSPGALSGMNDANSNSVYPIESFTAKAIGNAAGTGPADVTVAQPRSCGNSTSFTPMDASCIATASNTPVTTPPNFFWRVCLYATTSKGDVTWDSNSGQYATVIAITTCTNNSANQGSDLSVWAQ